MKARGARSGNTSFCLVEMQGNSYLAVETAADDVLHVMDGPGQKVALAARVDVRHPTCDSTIRRARTMKYKIDTMW